MSDLNLTSFNPLYPMRIHQYNELINDQNTNVMDKVNSIIDYLNQVGKLTNDVVKDWNTVYNWVMNEGLTTDVNNKLEDMLANHEFDPIMNTILTKIGDLTTLSTTAKDTIVNAINSLQSDMNTKIGDLTSLQTVDKSSLVHAVNENTTLLAQKATKAFITPEDFGAVGTSDDSTVLNNAVAFASTNHMSLKLMPGKTYKAKNISLPSNTVIEGNGATIMLADNASLSANDKLLMTSSSASNIKIKELKLDGNINIVSGSPSSGCDLFYCIGGSHLRFDNVTFQNSHYVAITIGDVDTIHIDRCKFLNIDAGIMSNSNYCYNAYITNNHFDGLGESEPITISGDVLNQHIIIIGNTMLNKVSGMGINIGREVQYDSDNTSRTHDVIISGNIIDTVSNGVNLTNVSGANIYGNIIKNCGFRGIQLNRLCTDIDIFDNDIDTVGLGHIDVSGLTSGSTLKVHHNTLKNPNNSGNPNGAYSFLFTGSTNITMNLWFENNLLYGGSHSTFINTYITGKVRFNENEYISFTTENINVNYQSATMRANRNTNIAFIGTAAATNTIDNGYINGTGSNMDTTLHFFSIQGYDTAYIDNTVNTASASLNTIPTQYDGKKITLIVKLFSSNTSTIDKTGNIVLQATSYSFASFTTVIMDFVCYNGKWYELNHLFA